MSSASEQLRGHTMMHKFESRCPGNDSRCKHAVMWGDRTDVLGRDGVPPCHRCASGDIATCNCN